MAIASRLMRSSPTRKELEDGGPTKTDLHDETEDLRRTVATHSFWWHRIDLGHGITTPGLDDSPLKLRALHLPPSLAGKTVLDIGAWDGFFSFEAERRGARRVLATDYQAWANPAIGDGGFEIAHAALSSRVEKKLIGVESLSPQSVGVFDVVLFLGVLYQAEDPMRYLRIVRSVCSDLAVVETHVDGLDYPRPMMVFYPGDTLNGNASNFWGPNPLAVEAMLREVGFSTVRRAGTFLETRMVFHARV